LSGESLNCIDRSSNAGSTRPRPNADNRLPCPWRKADCTNGYSNCHDAYKAIGRGAHAHGPRVTTKPVSPTGPLHSTPIAV
jgi:hypothetical protein